MRSFSCVSDVKSCATAGDAQIIPMSSGKIQYVREVILDMISPCINLEFGIVNSEFGMRNAELLIRNAQFAMHNSEFRICNL